MALEGVQDKDGGIMKNIDWKRKLTSRKFWLSVAAFVSLLIIASGKDKTVAEQVSAIIMAGATVIQVGTATFMRPEKALDIIDGMERYCEENGIQNLSEIRGIV